MSKFCIKCGNPLPDEAVFCTKCGSPQPAVQGSASAPQRQQAQPSQPIPPAQQARQQAAQNNNQNWSRPAGQRVSTPQQAAQQWNVQQTAQGQPWA